MIDLLGFQKIPNNNVFMLLFGWMYLDKNSTVLKDNIFLQIKFIEKVPIFGNYDSNLVSYFFTTFKISILAHWFKYVYGTPEKMIAAWPRLKLYNFNISIL